MIIVKHGDSNCRGSAWSYGQLCKPYFNDNGDYVLCAHCNWEEVSDLQTCNYITQYGAKCKRHTRSYDGFCSHHRYDAEGERVRDWYERSFDILKAEMAEALRKLPTYVYVISADGYIKIGYSANPEIRLKTLQSKSDATLKPNKVKHENMQIIKKVKGGQELERLLHAMCRQSHKIGEWFKHDSFTAEIIERLNDDWINHVR